MKVERTHDKLYLNEDYKSSPKEYYKFVKKEIISDTSFKSNSIFNLLDIGCETGSFLYFLKTDFPKAKLSGLDIHQDLLNKVNEQVDEDNKIHTICADISSRETLPKQKYDLITMLGVLSIFDNYESILDNVLTLLNDKGRLYIFGIFNPKDLDVLIKSRNSRQDSVTWESGWNCFSKLSIKNYCNKYSLNCEFKPFSLNMDIPEREEDPLRSWTKTICGNERMIINGLQLVHNFYLCKIWK